MAAGQLSTFANATSTVALWPGQLSSLWATRKRSSRTPALSFPLTLLGLVGGVIGSLLLTHTPAKVFDKVVPFLVLTATVLFMAQESLSRWQKARATAKSSPAQETEADSPGIRLTFPIALFLLGVAIYGGYFGAGIGILCLAAFGLMGMTNIHQMNGIKALFTLGINGVASAIFMFQGLVDWKIAGIMACGSIFGGWAGAGIARRIGQKNVRRVVIAIGLLLTLYLLVRY
jgi:uncharacterized membrane protein YfcA